MTKIALVYFSGYGHTQKLVEAVLLGVQKVAGVTGQILTIDKEGNLSQADWDSLNAADGIIFGSPTYMGTVSWQFKKFADATSKQWMSQAWKNKIAAGMTNSASMNGDKHSTLHYMITLAMQHSMVWVGTGLMPANSKAAVRNDINYLASFAGLMSQSPSDSSPDEGPLPGDLATGKVFGQRVAEVTAHWVKAGSYSG